MQNEIDDLKNRQKYFQAVSPTIKRAAELKLVEADIKRVGHMMTRLLDAPKQLAKLQGARGRKVAAYDVLITKASDIDGHIDALKAARQANEAESAVLLVAVSALSLINIRRCRRRG